jgi:deoxycytidine triphosphate deaminase
MVLNDSLLIRLAVCGMVDPYDPACINPSTVDLKLGYEYRRPDKVWDLHDYCGLTVEKVKKLPTWGEQQIMPKEGILLLPEEFILCCSLETVCIPVEYNANLYSKSSTGRKGLEHLHAGLIDPGFIGQLTFEFKSNAPWPIVLTPGEKIMQMELRRMEAPPAMDYSKTGRYQHQTGATPARETR